MSAERLFEVRFPAEPGRLKLVRGMVEQAAVLAGCAETVAAQVVIAVNEACMNIIQHAYHGDATKEIGLCVMSTGSELVCRVEDTAPPLDVAVVRPRDLDDLRPGGLGTHFMSELMDECCYGHLEGGRGNFLEMRKRIS